MARILIVDDDIHVARLLKTHFSEKGHDVVLAHRGADGMSEALKEAPDMIFLDVILPDVTGFQMCSRFRKTPATEMTPIVMMTGVARFPNQQAFAMERGANEYILKPFDILEMGEMVDRYVGPQASRRPAPKKVVSPPPEKTGSADLGALSHFLRKVMGRSKPHS